MYYLRKNGNGYNISKRDETKFKRNNKYYKYYFTKNQRRDVAKITLHYLIHGFKKSKKRKVNNNPFLIVFDPKRSKKKRY